MGFRVYRVQGFWVEAFWGCGCFGFRVYRVYGLKRLELLGFRFRVAGLVHPDVCPVEFFGKGWF